MLIVRIAQFFLMQAVILAVIVFILLKILNRNLTEGAVHKFEVLFWKEVDGDPEEIAVTAPGELSPKYKDRIAEAAFKKFERRVPVVVRKDRKIRGGLIIQVKNTVMDYSLSGRLRESGLVK